MATTTHFYVVFDLPQDIPKSFRQNGAPWLGAMNRSKVLYPGIVDLKPEVMAGEGGQIVGFSISGQVDSGLKSEAIVKDFAANVAGELEKLGARVTHSVRVVEQQS